MIYTVVPTRMVHVKPMATKLRGQHSSLLGAMGFDARRALHNVVRESHFGRTALVDGQPEAMWGLKGPLLGTVAYAWLAISERVARAPKLIVMEARAQLAEMARHYDELATTVLPDDEAAIRLAAFLGFHDHDDDGHRSHKERAAELRQNPRHRVPLGDGYVIALGWHGNA